MSNVKAGVIPAVQSSQAQQSFKAMLSERQQLLSDLRILDRELMRKCADEGWDDCIRLNYSRIHSRVR